MPFRSEKQKRYLWKNHPDIAKRWSKRYGNKINKLKGGGMDSSEPDFGTRSSLGNARENYISTQYGGGSKNTGNKGNGALSMANIVTGLVGKVIDFPLSLATTIGGKFSGVNTNHPTNPPKNDERGGHTTIIPPKQVAIQAPKSVSKSVSPLDNFFKFKAYRVGGLSGGVRYGPPPLRGPNPQVPPVKLRKGSKK